MVCFVFRKIFSDKFPSPPTRSDCLVHGLSCCKTESEVTQSFLTLCDPMDCSPPDSSVHGIFQARILEWAAISSPGDLPNPGIKPRSPALKVAFLTTAPLGKKPIIYFKRVNSMLYAVYFSKAVTKTKTKNNVLM